jgi:anti-sigma regulatory factor (Ser/Thr protein kinase)
MSMMDLAFAPDVEAPAAARAELGDLGLERAEGQAVMLLASELVTNCIRHAGVGRRQRIRLRALVTDTLVRIEVIDSGAGMRVVMRTGDDHGGWGLRLVDRIADRWGVVRDAGTHVWFEIDRPGGAATEGMTRSAGAQPLSVLAAD